MPDTTIRAALAEARAEIEWRCQKALAAAQTSSNYHEVNRLTFLIARIDMALAPSSAAYPMRHLSVTDLRDEAVIDAAINAQLQDE